MTPTEFKYETYRIDVAWARTYAHSGQFDRARHRIECGRRVRISLSNTIRATARSRSPATPRTAG